MRSIKWLVDPQCRFVTRLEQVRQLEIFFDLSTTVPRAVQVGQLQETRGMVAAQRLAMQNAVDIITSARHEEVTTLTK